MQSDILKARYSETAVITDKLNRNISVRRLRPSEQTRLAGMTAELNGYDEMTNESGDKIRIPHRMPLQIAASVCQVDDDLITFPRNRGDLDAIFDRLDIEGIKAAGEGVSRLESANRSVLEETSEVNVKEHPAKN